MATSKGLTIISVGLYLGSVVSAVLATRRLKDKPVKENIEVYIPSVVFFTTGTMLLAMANVRDTRRMDALAGAYHIVRDSLEELRGALPANALNNAEHKIMQESVEAEFEIPAGKNVLIPPNVYGLDRVTGQSFVNSVESIHRACQALNYQIINGGMATMDDYCDELGLEHIQGGNRIGWTSGPIVYKITTKLKDDVLPVVVVSVEPLPSPL